MPHFSKDLPLSLYVHIPWCVRKCPYCDFNSHEASGSLPESLYVQALLSELKTHAESLRHRPLVSIFFGGGTPSLFSAKAIEQILDGAANHLTLPAQTEITLEANPGTIDQVRFRDFRKAGINRLSIGIQSLQNDKLRALGRIHDRDNALRAITLASEAGFDNFNLDLMYGLPEQTIDDALQDLTLALSFQPAHLSWYQLTIEPNTFFHHQPPVLPPDDTLWEMQIAGQQCLRDAGLQQYEVSAYAMATHECRHNRNYWIFGDYLGIGAGAHSKLTHRNTDDIVRFAQVKHPRDYLEAAKRQSPAIHHIQGNDRIFEFMLNALRLTHGVPASLFTEHTGLPFSSIQEIVLNAKRRGLLVNEDQLLCASDLGHRYLNNLTALFLPA